MSGVAPEPLTARQWTASLTDPGLPVVSELLTEELPGPLEALVAAADGTVTGLRLAQVTWWPGRSITVSWDAVVGGGPFAGPGSYVATTQEAPDGAVLVGSGEDAVAVWRVPHDPFLPALPTALLPDVAASVVADLGGEITGPSTRLRAYRPTRRAVIEVTGQGHRIYFKLVKPHRLHRLHERHVQLAEHLPVPVALAISTDLGLLAMESMSGATLREVLEDPGARLPDPTVVAHLGSTVPRLPRMSPVLSSVESLPQVAGVLAALLPMEAGRIADLVDAIGPDEVTDRVPAHGDFHEAQLLVEDGQVTGILDVDTVGLARPADDAATMLGHLAVWHTMSGHPDRVAAYATELQRRWDAVLDPVDLRLRAAARILGLATGPFRVQQEDWPLETSRRLALAERWAASARRVRGAPGGA